MEEGYVRPERFLVMAAIWVPVSLALRAVFRSKQTEGRQTMFGLPESDVERLMSHYGMSEEEAVGLLATYPINLLLPERGSGLAPVEIVGYSQGELASGLELMESSVNFGEKARVTFCTKALPDEILLAEMYLGIIATGHHVSYPTAAMINGIPTTEFVITKGSPVWALIIPILIPLFTIGLITFGITRIEAISKALVPIILISVSGLIILAAVLAKPATKYLEKAGKLPLVPSTEQLAKKAVAVS